VTDRRRLTQGQRESLRFYRGRLARKAAKLNRPMPVPDYLLPLIAGRSEVMIADLAAGPFPLVGTGSNGTRVRVVASDLLAPEFAAMLAEAGITPLLPVERQDMEALTYPDGAFDVVHCVNALDHTPNPLRALREMVRVCKPGGWVYFRCYPDCGVEHSYHGLHMWNVSMAGPADARVWSPDASFLVSAVLPGCLVEFRPEAPYTVHDVIVATWQKGAGDV
jgi:SAM-dependent methyltransferase